ncbi:MAG TPA: phenylalanine--tRNA ligase subunit beta, partial [Candidatus Dormibacteraeota bacterium]|nr:phenylalanine--tRNA ligase subunit beta [Candidatus Dormibacteraeota bacterium]
VVIDAEVSSNRPDCLGHLGMAREVSAIFKVPLKFAAPKLADAAAKTSAPVEVKIETPELCGRFTARLIRGVKIQPSPPWLKDRLEACGVSSINNVVDISNYVMLELGHPLHAFDYDKIREQRIVVRKSKPGEKTRTLDGVERTLGANIGVVCDGDGSRVVGIAGIMGGAETEISFSTSNVLIECAWFNPVAVRQAARNLRLHTEASTRFGRGADPEMAEVASRRCAELILQVAGGKLEESAVDEYPVKFAAKKIRVTRTELLRVMGADVSDKEITGILSSLGFAPVRVDDHQGTAGSLLAAWECTQPSWRADVEREIDLIEEIARIHGLDKFPPRLPAARSGAARLPHFEAENRLRERLIGLGYREILTIPHVAEERDELFRPAGVSATRLSNPLSEEAGVLRSSGSVSMVGALEWNLNHSQRDARLFEIAHHYRLDGDKSVETRVLTIGATGDAREQGLYDGRREFSFADLKGDLDSIGELAGRFSWNGGNDAGGYDWLNASKRGRISLGKEELGAAGLLARRVAERLKIRQDAFLAELRLEPFYRGYYGLKNSRKYESLPRFPAVDRDFSLLLPEGVHFSDVTKAIQSLDLAEVSSIEAADLFRGKNVPAGKYSLLVRVKFQSHAGTLTETQITDYSGKIVAALAEVGAQLRAA